MNGTSVPIGSRYRKFQTPANNYTILAFGVLFDFTGMVTLKSSFLKSSERQIRLDLSTVLRAHQWTLVSVRSPWWNTRRRSNRCPRTHTASKHHRTWVRPCTLRHSASSSNHSCPILRGSHPCSRFPQIRWFCTWYRERTLPGDTRLDQHESKALQHWKTVHWQQRR